MKRKKTIFASLIVLAVIGITSACTESKNQRIIIKGSTTVLPIIQHCAETYAKQHRKALIFASGTGSTDGISALIKGDCTIATSSRSIKDEERADAERTKVKLKEIVIAYDMIAAIVNKSNPIENITLKDLAAIYRGEISSWKKLNGSSQQIFALTRDKTSGTYEIWEHLVMKNAAVSSSVAVQPSNEAILNGVAANPAAIGYIGHGYIDNSIKVIKIEGVNPDVEEMKSGNYPISRKLYLYVNENTLSEPGKNFIDFILSGEGQKLIAESGFIPL